MKTRLTLMLIIIGSFLANGQNVIIGTNGFLSKNPLSNEAGFGFYTRMGVELFDVELGLKTFYGKLSSLEAYGVSFYTFIPIYRIKKWEAVTHVEGGFSFVYNDLFGSEHALQMGFGPGLRYRVNEYFNIELILEYAIFANITRDQPLYTHVLIPTIGWSVRI